MKLSDEIRILQKDRQKCCWQVLQDVLDMLSARGRKAGSAAKKKKRGDSVHYKEMAQERWDGK
jgi:hypothetical protein